MLHLKKNFPSFFKNKLWDYQNHRKGNSFFESYHVKFSTNLETLVANSTLNILFSEMLKFSKLISSKSKNIMKDNSEYFGIFQLLK